MWPASEMITYFLLHQLGVRGRARYWMGQKLCKPPACFRQHVEHAIASRCETRRARGSVDPQCFGRIETSTYRLSIASRALQEMHDRTISVPDCVSFRTRSDCLSRALPPPAYLWGRGRTRCRCESSTCSRAWTSRGFAFLQTTDRAVSFSSTRPGCDCPWFLPYPRGKGPARRGSFGSSPHAAASCRLRSRHAAHRAFCRSFCSSVLGLTSRFGFTLASTSTYALPVTGSVVARSISSPVQASATVGCVVRGDLAHPTLRPIFRIQKIEPS
jgi:hypothetical protein